MQKICSINDEAPQTVTSGWELLTECRQIAVANDNINKTVLCFKYRLLPRRKQHKQLSDILEKQRELYNAALTERIDAYSKIKKTISYFDQCKSLTEIRKDDARLPANLQRATLKRLDEAFKGFFRRLKKSGKAGFPRYKGKGWWSSFSFSEFSGIRFDGKSLKFKGLDGKLRVHIHRVLPDDAEFLGCTFKRDIKGWTVSFQVRTDKKLLASTGEYIGIDMGLNALAMLSTGEIIRNIKTTKRHERKIRLHSRRLARCKKGLKRRVKVKQALARCHAKIANTRNTHLHQVSAMLVRRYDEIVIEDLNVKKLASGTLAKSVNDASWGKLRRYLTYKADNAGKRVIAVDPRHTSQICSGCGYIVKKSLSVRVHSCAECGLMMDRDKNAAINILARSGALVSQDKAVAYV